MDFFARRSCLRVQKYDVLGLFLQKADAEFAEHLAEEREGKTDDV